MSSFIIVRAEMWPPAVESAGTLRGRLTFIHAGLQYRSCRLDTAFILTFQCGLSCLMLITHMYSTLCLQVCFTHLVMFELFWNFEK